MSVQLCRGPHVRDTAPSFLYILLKVFRKERAEFRVSNFYLFAKLRHHSLNPEYIPRPMGKFGCGVRLARDGIYFGRFLFRASDPIEKLFLIPMRGKRADGFPLHRTGTFSPKI